MSLIDLKTYNKNQPREYNEDALQDNTNNLRKALQRQAVNLLADLKVTQNIDIAGTSLARVPAFDIAFKSSGGLINVKGAIYYDCAADRGLYLAVKYDTTELMKYFYYGHDRITGAAVIDLMFQPGEGNHSLSIWAYRYNNTVDINSATEYSRLQLIEYLF